MHFVLPIFLLFSLSTSLSATFRTEIPASTYILLLKISLKLHFNERTMSSLSVCSSYSTSSNSSVTELPPCKLSVPGFAPLGGSRPDAAVVACAAVGLYTGGLPEGVVVAFDVLDTALAVLCAPLIITHVRDLRGREAHFGCPAASVRLRTTDEDVFQALERISVDIPEGGLSVFMSLEEWVIELPDHWMQMWPAVGQVDLGRTSLTTIGDSFLAYSRNLAVATLPPTLTGVGGGFLWGCKIQHVDLSRTSLQRIGDSFLGECPNLTAVTLPPSLSEVGRGFLGGCNSIRHLDLQHTALNIIGPWFLANCSNLTSVVLPDTVTHVGRGFLYQCGRVEVTSGSPPVEAAAVEHNREHNT